MAGLTTIECLEVHHVVQRQPVQTRECRPHVAGQKDGMVRHQETKRLTYGGQRPVYIDS